MRTRTLPLGLSVGLLTLATACPADVADSDPATGSSSGDPISMGTSGNPTGSSSTEPGPTTGPDPATTTGDPGTSSGETTNGDASTTGTDESSSDGGTTTGAEAVCGNGRVEGNEECDSAVPSATCDDDCTLAECGDGVVNALAGETCDDGNGDNGDTCPDGPEGTCRAAECGDGFICIDAACTSGATGGNEDCDDGNQDEGDGCSDACRIEGGGCADGLREGFVDGAANPLIAGCSGGFTIPGVTSPPACGNAAGDDSANPGGVDCSVADLCAPGWHVCESPAEVAALSATGCENVTLETDDPLFFVQQISGLGAGMCDGLGTNDIFGCGNLGAIPNAATCDPLNRFSQNGCGPLGADWDCGVAGIEEALVVVKPGVDSGGALCCID